MDLDTALTVDPRDLSDSELDAAWKLLGEAKLAIRRKYDLVPTMGMQAINGKVPHDAMTRCHARLNREVQPYLDRIRLITDLMMDRQMDAAQARSRKRLSR